jgi:hypothetical protein
MGMYTELNIGVKFRTDTPSAVIDALLFMVLAEGDAKRPASPSICHPLFEAERWTWMLRSEGSYYFDRVAYRAMEFDEITGAWFLSVATNIKNYSDEWQHFIDFIAPWIETDGFIGTYRYEADDAPTLLYAADRRVIWQQVTPPGPGRLE